MPARSGGMNGRAALMGLEALRRANRVHWRVRRRLRDLPLGLVRRGLAPARLGWRWVERQEPRQYLARLGLDGPVEVVHPPAVARNPLPGNIDDRAQLDSRAGWFGYAFRDVPRRASGETALITLPDVRIVACRTGPRRDFSIGMVGRDDRSIELPQVSLRPHHGPLLRSSAPPLRLDHATWIVERVYDNHSHWLTAHLPKLVLLQSLDRLDGLVLPARRTGVMDTSMRRLGLDPALFRTVEFDRIIEVDALTVVVSDRFRPEMLRPVREAIAGPGRGAAHRRILISREKARGRKLLNEADLWPQLQARGFERVVMEELDFDQQIALMQQTAVLVAPHGAGLTNMMFCPEGADIVEIADPGYPNPNFYALASAMGHRYWLLHGQTARRGHPLDRDLSVDGPALLSVIDRVEAARG